MAAARGEEAHCRRISRPAAAMLQRTTSTGTQPDITCCDRAQNEAVSRRSGRGVHDHKIVPALFRALREQVTGSPTLLLAEGDACIVPGCRARAPVVASAPFAVVTQ